LPGAADQVLGACFMGHDSRMFIRPHPRRRVSRRRHMAGFLVLGLLVGAAVLYSRVTDEARLRAYAEKWVAGFTGGECRIAHVTLDWSAGLTLQGVTIALPESAHFDPADNSLAARTILRASSVFLRLRAFSVITGRLAVPEIVTVDPELILVKRLPDGVGNWQAMFRRREGGTGGGTLRLPVVRFRNARVEQYRLDERGRSGGAAQLIWADAQPLPEHPEIYDVRLSKVMHAPGSDRMTGEAARVQVNLSTLALAGSLPTMSIDELLFGLPPEVLRWLDLLELRGYVRPDTLSYDRGAGGKVTLALRDASLALPPDAEEQRLPAAERFLRFDEIGGRIQFDGGAAAVDLQGKFRGHPVKLTGRMTRSEGGSGGSAMSAVGLDLSIDLTDVPLPRADAEADPAEARFVKRWPRLANFVRDFDGIGPVDLSVQLRKPPGEGGIEFVQGTMRLKGDSARYLHFPYRLHDITGVVHFRNDSTETIDLVGTHGGARISITGWEGGFKSQAGDLRIQAQNVPLDDDLRRCLEEDDQALCRRFAVAAKMNLDVHLTRRDAPPGTPDNPWRSVIDVTFLDGSASFEKFPYPLTGITGRMRIEGGRFDVQGLTARRGRTTVRVSGWASGAASEHASLDLQIAAEDVELDDSLAAALPASARLDYDRIAPTGRASLAGRLFTKPGSDDFLYDFVTNLRDATVAIPGTTARLTDVQCQLHVLPDELAVESLTGHFGESPIRLQGKLTRRPELMFTFDAASEKLLLDDTLRTALPSGWQSKWADFKPAGAVRLNVHVESGGQGPATSQPAVAGTHAATTQPAFTYTASIQPLEAQVTYAGFPLELRKIKGEIEVTPAGAELRGLTAEHGPTRVRLSGKVAPSKRHTGVELALEADHLQFTEDLRQAVPWRIRRQWNEVSPSGEMDVKFERLAFTTGGESTDWQFRGQARFRDVGMRVGPALTEITGTLDASGQVGRQLAINGRLALDRGRVDGRLVTRATATLVRAPSESVFKLENLFGQFYGGAIAGWADVNYGLPKPAYRVSLSIRDMSLEQFLNGQLQPGQQPLHAQGLVAGTLNVSGQSDDLASRRGGGNLIIREAQMFKIPMMLKILQVVNLQSDDNAFHDATASFSLVGPHVILDEIDLRGKSLSMVGAGSIYTPTDTLDLSLLIGGPVHLPRLQVLTEFLEGVARELMQVRVSGTVREPKFRAEVVHSLRSAVETILNARRPPQSTASNRAAASTGKLTGR
jgi:hypothetical protein